MSNQDYTAVATRALEAIRGAQNVERAITTVGPYADYCAKHGQHQITAQLANQIAQMTQGPRPAPKLRG